MQSASINPVTGRSLVTITIITTALNAESVIEDCLKSVRNQRDVSVEHIVIDGGSQDRTVEIVQNSGHTSGFISEPDNGIYDAMNKGIALATGDIVGFLNADDYYTDDQVLSRVVRAFRESSVASCYGDLQYVDFSNTARIIRHWRSGAFAGPKQFYWGWMPPHPTFFVHRDVYEKYGTFNLELGSAADYEIMLRFLVKHRVKTAYIPEVLVRMRTGGVSNASVKNRLAANRMDRKAWTVNGLKPYPWTLWMKPLRKIRQWFVKTA